jgi:hypothetical protein
MRSNMHMGATSPSLIHARTHTHGRTHALPLPQIRARQRDGWTAAVRG